MFLVVLVHAGADHEEVVEGTQEQRRIEKKKRRKFATNLMILSFNLPQILYLRGDFQLFPFQDTIYPGKSLYEGQIL